ncbi:MAG: thiamine phosphate synthase [Chloroflexi bacterium]|nr:thiamine phosphate synthase [Chloroflexota bacterium]
MRPTLPTPCLCLVTDRSLCDGTTFLKRISAAVAGGVDLVQLREKDLPGGKLLNLANRIRDIIGGSALLVINERVDVAVAVGADAVQLGEVGLPTAAARKMLGEDVLIGRSVHSLAGATQASAAGADFLLVGTMFASRSHPVEEPAGPGLLRGIASQSQLPLIGIGGIDATNAGEVMDAGAQGVAVIRSILASDDPKSAAQQIKQAMLASAAATRATCQPS